MPAKLSATEVLSKFGGAGESILRGSDLPKSTRTITVKVTGVREPGQGFMSPLVVDIDPLPDLPTKTTIALNKTNVRRLAELVGDDLSQLVGRKVTFEKTLVNNPKTNQLVYGLVATAVSKR